MKHKRIYILDGHPAERSLSRSLVDNYADSARAAGHEVRIGHLHQMEFDCDFGDGGYKHSKPLEPVLEQVLDNIEWSQHLVMATPLWWGGLPAKLKGLIDRVLLPSRAFDTRVIKLGGVPSPLLTGRTARILLTSDTPSYLMRLLYKNALLHQLRSQILGFVGFKPTRVSQFTGASQPKPGSVEQWLKQVRALGASAR